MNTAHELLKRIHDTPHKAVVVVAGAGGQGLAWLLDVPGASRTLLEGLVPYSQRSMVDFLGNEPAQYVSPSTAKAMARAAYQRGTSLRGDGYPVVGLACTATIVTDRPKRGDHRCCIAAWDQKGVSSYSLTLAKGLRDRAGEEEVVSRLLIHALGKACALEPDLDLKLIDSEAVQEEHQAHLHPVHRLVSGDINAISAEADGRYLIDEPLPVPALLPGSFNPLHYGHLQLAQAAQSLLGQPVAFELSVVNVDKPPLELAEVQLRLGQFAGMHRVLLTRAETFRKKAALFPGCAFVIGWDTAVRLVEPRYYGNDQTAMLAALAQMWALGCRFLVAGRRDQDKFCTLDDVPVPEGFQPMFQAIPESLFRADVSSTALRAQRHG
ncbi:MAG: hypothetical protein FJ316_03100 [SAR202 cluster bacterium]|nr:hypothetical protein [SAR202 cluster bacterium]